MRSTIVAEVQSLSRGLDILDLLAGEGSLGVTEIARVIQVDKSTASRLVQTLVGHGFVEQEGRRYRMSTKVMTLSRRILNQTPLNDRARPFLYELVEQTGECAHIAIYSRGQAYVLEDIETASLLRVAGGAGRMTPLHCTALGKCLLAFSDVLMPAQLPGRTARTITDPQQLRLHLEQVRHQGYAVDDEELETGVRCLAAPVYDYSGKAIAAIGISGPAVRVSVERLPELGRLVSQAGLALSETLGYSPHGG
jgi:IclR family transcriptional regulator, KDG regulon repressor